jgi:hypothetical protein
MTESDYGATEHSDLPPDLHPDPSGHDVDPGYQFDDVAASYSGVETMDVPPVWETAPATDLGAALAFAQHLVDHPEDSPALQGTPGLANIEQTVQQIAGPEVVAADLGQTYTPGETYDDILWQQLGVPNGDLQAFIDSQSQYVDQVAAQLNPGLSGPVPGFEQFYGPLGLQTASGVPLPTLGHGSWFGASADVAGILGPYDQVLFPGGVWNPQY